MKKIKWKQLGSGDVGAEVGSVRMECWKFSGKSFRACISIEHIARTVRYGRFRQSMAKAKEDAMRLAYELLEDYQVAVEKEVKLLARMEN